MAKDKTEATAEELTPAEVAQAELDAINVKKAEAQAELDQIDEDIANATDELDELSAEEKAELEDNANNPSKKKYDDMVKNLKGVKGADKKPLIAKGKNYEITLNKRK